MNLYELHDDPDGILDWEEKTWLAVWADTPEEAQAIYLVRLPALTEYSKEDIGSLVPRCKVATWKGDEFQPEGSEPHEENRPQVLRSLGWAYEDERSCEACDLRAFGVPEFAVCSECGLCRECRSVSQIERCEDCQGDTPPQRERLTVLAAFEVARIVAEEVAAAATSDAHLVATLEAQRDRLAVLAAWQAGEISEGQFCALARLDPLAAREMLQQTVAAVLERWRMYREAHSAEMNP